MICKFNFNFWTGTVIFLTIVIISSPSVRAVVNGQKSSQEIILNACKRKASQNGKLEALEIPGFLSSTSSKLTFRVTPKTPSCKSKIELTLNSSTNSGLTNFLPNGYFRNDTEYFHPEEYCLTSSNGGSRIKIVLCRIECTSQRPCSQMCCPLGQILVDRVGCVDETLAPVELNSVQNVPSLDMKYLQRIPHYKRQDVEGEMSFEDLALQPFHYTRTESKVIKSNCKPLNVTPEYVNDGEAYNERRVLFKVTLSGNLLVKHFANETWHTIYPRYYCLNEFRDKGTLIYLCPHGTVQDTTRETNTMRNLIIGISLILSSIFLLLTFIVYACILKQRNVHSWTTMSLTATMFFTYTFLAVSHFISAHEYRTEDGEPTGRCTAIGILAHYFFLSMFCWLTTVCFDLWWTFRAITPKNKNATGWSRFLVHATFGWGAPLVVIIVSVSLNSFYSCTTSDDGSSNCILLPNYGKESCYLASESLGLYLYYPAAVLLTLNWIFFLLTFYKLYEYKKSTKMAMQNTQVKRKLLLLCLKLFFVMGISWLLEIISWLHSSNSPNPAWYWYITGIFNIFQSVAIFLIFTCKKETLDALKAMMPEKKKSANYRIVPTKSDSTTKGSEPDTNIRLATLTEKDGKFRFTQTTTSFTNDSISET